MGMSKSISQAIFPYAGAPTVAYGEFDREIDEAVDVCSHKSNSTLESQSQNHSQKLRMLLPKTLTYGVFDCDFGFGSQEWSCSK